jgi:hypothetical protein
MGFDSFFKLWFPQQRKMSLGGWMQASKQSKQSKQDFIGLTGAFSVTLGTDTH